MLLQRGLFKTKRTVIDSLTLLHPLAREGWDEGAKGDSTMATPIQWETSLTTAKAKAKKEKKMILMDFYNNL
jgi:hypothetical protein